jgi:hypothetical protein
MIRKTEYLWLLLFCLIFSFSTAIAKVIEHEKSWTNFNLNGSLFHSKKFKYLLGSEIRLVDRNPAYENSIVTTGLGYKVNDNLLLWGALQQHFPYRMNHVVAEKRLFERVSWRLLNAPSVILWSHSQLEEKIKKVKSTYWRERVRERAVLTFPKIFGKKVVPVLWDEVFIILERAGPTREPTLEQNRLFGGLDLYFKDSAFLEVGYMNQHLFRQRGDESNHIAYVSLNAAL